jgi:hypothetical protein
MSRAIELNPNFMSDLQEDLKEPFEGLVANSTFKLIENVKRGPRSGRFYSGARAQSSSPDGSQYSQEQESEMVKSADYEIIRPLFAEVGFINNAPAHALFQEIGTEKMNARNNVYDTMIDPDTGIAEEEGFNASA